MARRSLTELSDRELEKASDRTWRKHYEVVKEQQRRRLIQRYGTENPELNTYTVDLRIDHAPLTVKSRSAEEARIIAEGETYLMTDACDQVHFDDMPDYRVHDVELIEGEEAETEAAD